MAAMHVDQQVADQRLPQVLPARDIIFERHTPMLMLARTKVGETLNVRGSKEAVVGEERTMEGRLSQGRSSVCQSNSSFSPLDFRPPKV